MAFKISTIDVWVADILNRPGSLARVLEALSNAGAQLEFMVARRVSEATTRVFVAPLKSAKQRRAAQDEGLVKAAGMHTVRIEGPDRAGLGAHLARAIAGQGINIRSASGAALSKKSVLYFAFATAADLKNGTAIIRKALRSGK